MSALWKERKKPAPWTQVRQMWMGGGRAGGEGGGQSGRGAPGGSRWKSSL